MLQALWSRFGLQWCLSLCVYLFLALAVLSRLFWDSWTSAFLPTPTFQAAGTTVPQQHTRLQISFILFILCLIWSISYWKEYGIVTIIDCLSFPLGSFNFYHTNHKAVSLLCLGFCVFLTNCPISHHHEISLNTWANIPSSENIFIQYIHTQHSPLVCFLPEQWIIFWVFVFKLFMSV